MDDALAAPGTMQQIASRNVVDGDKLAEALKSQRAAAGIKDEAFDVLLNMIRNDTAKRPSVDDFLARFGSEKFIEP